MSSRFTGIILLLATVFWFGSAYAGETRTQKDTLVRIPEKDALAMFYIEEGRRLEAQGETAKAAEFLDRAVSTAPDLPAVYLAKAQEEEAGLGQWIRELWKAFKAIPQNTAWSVTLLGGLMFVLLWGIWGLLAAYFLAQAALKAPLLFHDAREGNKKRFYAAALSLGGFLFGFIPALLVAAAVLRPYFTRRERIPLFGMAVWAILSYWIIMWGGAFLAFPSSPQAKAVVEVNEYRGDLYAAGMIPPMENDWARGLTRGLILARTGHFEDAIEVYENIEGVTGRRKARLKNNIANCWFRMGEIPRALEAYIELKDSGLVTVLYNLSQAYREVLRFNDGDRLFEEAQKVDADAVERFRETGFIVADETLTPMERIEFIATMGDPRSSMVQNLYHPLILVIPPQATPVLGILFLVIFLGAFGKKQKQANAAFRCRQCHEIFCPKCDAGATDGMCSRCGKPVDLQGSDDPAQRIAQLINVRKRRGHQREFLRTLCVVPGLSDLAAGRPWSGFVLLALWVFSILLVIVPLPIVAFRGMESMTGLRMLAFVGLVVLYVANFLSVMRRISKGWL